MERTFVVDAGFVDDMDIGADVSAAFAKRDDEFIADIDGKFDDIGAASCEFNGGASDDEQKASEQSDKVHE